MRLSQQNDSTTSLDPVLALYESKRRDPDTLSILNEHFEILDFIGQGASGKVFKARQRIIDRLVAIKLLWPELISSEKNLKNFQREARTISSLAHPNIVKVYSMGLSAEKIPFLVMDYLEGKSLATILADEPFTDLCRCLKIFAQIASALAHAHETGILHGDIKPGNIMVSKQTDGSDKVTLLDFGIARCLQGTGVSETTAGKVVGTPAYMSPEQCRGTRLDCRSDIYSLGCVMYQVLAKRPPFVGNTVVETLLKQLHDEPSALRKMAHPGLVPRRLSELVHKCLAKSKEQRPQSAAEICSVLDELLKSPEQKTAPDKICPAVSSLSVRRRNNTMLICSASILVLAFLLSFSANKKTKLVHSTQNSSNSSEACPANMSAGLAVRRADQELARGNNLAAASFYKVALQKVEQRKKAATGDSVLALNRALYAISLKLAKADRQSESVRRQAILYAKEAYGPNSYQASEAQYQLADLLAAASPNDEAEQLCRKSIATRIQLLGGEENTRVATLYSLLGFIFEIRGNFAEAIKIQTKALRLWRAAVDNEDDDGILWSLYRLGCHQYKARHYLESDNCFTELRTRSCGSPDVPPELRQLIMESLINFYYNENEKAKAQSACQEYILACEKSHASSAASAADALAQAYFCAAMLYSNKTNSGYALYYAEKCRQKLESSSRIMRSRLTPALSELYQKLSV